MATTLPTLRELVEQRDLLDQLIAEQEGEVTPDIQAVWDQLDGNLEQKGENVARWLRAVSAEVEALKAEEKWLRDKRCAREAALDKSKAWFRDLLVRLDRKELGTPIAKLCRQANSAPSVIVDETVVTQERLQWLRTIEPTFVKITYSLEKKVVGDAMGVGGVGQAGTMFAGIKVEKGEHLRVR